MTPSRTPASRRTFLALSLAGLALACLPGAALADSISSDSAPGAGFDYYEEEPLGSATLKFHDAGGKCDGRVDVNCKYWTCHNPYANSDTAGLGCNGVCETESMQYANKCLQHSCILWVNLNRTWGDHCVIGGPIVIVVTPTPGLPPATSPCGAATQANCYYYSCEYTPPAAPPVKWGNDCATKCTNSADRATNKCQRYECAVWTGGVTPPRNPTGNNCWAAA